MEKVDQERVFVAAQALVQWFESEVSYVIALSGGVDSAVVAAAAARAGCQCVAVTARSPSVAAAEMEDAEQVAKQIGIEHHFVDTSEIGDEHYQRNDGRRCFHCKTHLFTALGASYPNAVIVTGTNLDDLGDYRPGLEAAQNAGVRAPLAELGITKDALRAIGHSWSIEIADKPASPCLASRLAYGVEVTTERLYRVEQAETFLRKHVGQVLRVRTHDGELARIEVPVDQIERVARTSMRQLITESLKELGFRYVTLDLIGFQSGNLNQQLVQIQSNGSTGS
ncbi:MAG: ATP-dependent sacrificial sulfur transferase LarE [Aureliella sp.]